YYVRAAQLHLGRRPAVGRKSSPHTFGEFVQRKVAQYMTGIGAVALELGLGGIDAVIGLRIHGLAAALPRLSGKRPHDGGRLLRPRGSEDDARRYLSSQAKKLPSLLVAGEN